MQSPEFLKAPVIRMDEFVTKELAKREAVLSESLVRLGVVDSPQDDRIRLALEVFQQNSQKNSAMGGDKKAVLPDKDRNAIFQCVSEVGPLIPGLVVEARGANVLLPGSLGTSLAAIDDKKLADLMREAKEPFFSFEYFPPKTADGVANLKKRILRMKNLNPLFVDFTWGAGGSTSDLTLELTAHAKNEIGCVSNMHLTCTNQTVSLAGDALKKCREVGVRNIVALRGDAPRGQEKWEATEGGFTCALDLVKKVREWHGDYFTVSVAGYPEGHPDAIEVVEGGIAALSEAEKRRCRVTVDEAGKEVVMVCKDESFRKEMEYLKAKVDAGSDFIITQMFLDAQVYTDFLQHCKDYGITVPVIPGIMCLTGYGGFGRMTALCKTRLPEGMELAAKEASAGGDDAFKQWGIEMGAEMCQKCLDAGAQGLHFYTLNLEKVVVGTLLKLGRITEAQAALCQAGDADAKSMVSAQNIVDGGAKPTAA